MPTEEIIMLRFKAEIRIGSDYWNWIERMITASNEKLAINAAKKWYDRELANAPEHSEIWRDSSLNVELAVI